MKPKIKLRVVQAEPPRDKLAKAIEYLRSRNLYVLDKGARKPGWGVPYESPPESPLMRAVMDADRRRK